MEVHVEIEEESKEKSCSEKPKRLILVNSGSSNRLLIPTLLFFPNFPL